MRRKRVRLASFLCCIRCLRLATIEELPDDAVSVDSYFGGTSELLVFPDRCKSVDTLVAAYPILFPISVSREVVLVRVEPRQMKLLTVSSA